MVHLMNVDECKYFDNPMQLMKHLSDITKHRICSLTAGPEGELLKLQFNIVLYKYIVNTLTALKSLSIL